MGKREETNFIKKMQTYQNVITMTNPDISIKTVRRESGNKSQRTT